MSASWTFWESQETVLLVGLLGSNHWCPPGKPVGGLGFHGVQPFVPTLAG